jgi:hypothetical protein
VDYVSPYLIKNLTGYKISAEEYVNLSDYKNEGSELGKKDDGRKRGQTKYKKEMLGVKYNLENQETLNLKFETASQFKKNEGEGKMVLEEARTNKKLMVNILHDQFSIKTLYDMSLDQRYSKRKHLEGDHKIVSEFSIICDNYFDDKKKILTISSPALVQNLTDEPFTVRILTSKDPLDLELHPKDLKPIPFDLIGNLYQIIFNGVETEKISLRKFTNKEDGYVKKIKLSDNKFIIARIKRDPDIFQRIIIVFLPVIKIKNCLPFLMDFKLEQSGADTLSHELLPQSEIQLYNFDPSQKLLFCMKTQGFNYNSPITLISDMKDCDVEEVPLVDVDGKKNAVKLARISNSENIFTYYIYAAALLINETELEFDTYYVKNQKSVDGQMAGGTKPLGRENFNRKLTLLRTIESNIKLTLSEGFLQEKYPGYVNSKQDEIIPLTALDSLVYQSTIENKANPLDKKGFELGAYLSLLFVDKKENLYTKIIQISPRNIFYNCTKQPIQIRQQDTTEILAVIQPSQRAPFWWSSLNKEKKLSVRLNVEGAQWSNKIDVKVLGSTPMMIKHDGQNMFFNYEVKIDSGIEFTYFKEEDISDPSFAFKNSSKKCKVEVYQKGFEDQSKTAIGQDEEVVYSWIAPDSKKIVVFKCTAPGFNDTAVEVDLSKINTNQRIKVVSLDKSTERILNLGVNLRKTTKFVEVRDVIDIKEEESAEKQALTQQSKNLLIVDLNLKAIGISLISPHENTKIEPLYIYFGGIEVLYSVNDFTTVIHFRIKNWNIDNNTTSMSPFPVLLTPSFKKKSMEDNYYLFSFVMEKRNESKAEVF